MKLSEYKRELELLRLFIQTERFIWNTLIRCIRTLKSDEDKRVYLEHVAKEHGEEYAFNLARVLQMVWPQNNEEEFDEKEFEPPKLRLLQTQEKDLEQHIKFLNKKKAA